MGSSCRSHILKRQVVIRLLLDVQANLPHGTVLDIFFLEPKLQYMMLLCQRMKGSIFFHARLDVVLFCSIYIFVLSIIHVIHGSCSVLSLFAFQFRLCSIEYIYFSCLEAWAGDLRAPTRSVGVPWSCRKDCASLLIVLLICSLRTDWILKNMFLFFQ